MRPPRGIRALRQNIEDRDIRFGRTDVLEDQPYTQALEQLLPQIAAESQQVARVVRMVFDYYRRKRSGRRCSCFEVEGSPNANCQICYGAGYVGGWDLHGCRSEWIEVTYPGLMSVNVSPNYTLGTRPVVFTLDSGVNEGFIEVDLPLIRNIKKTQTLQLSVGNQSPGSKVTAWIKASADLDFVRLTEESLNARLDQTKVRIQVRMSRQNTQMESPRFSHLMVRYQLIPQLQWYGDVNLSEDSYELGDLGLLESFSTLSIYVPPSFDRIDTEDFLIRTSDQKRFKVTKYERNCVSEVLLSHMVFARLLLPDTDPLLVFP